MRRYSISGIFTCVATVLIGLTVFSGLFWTAAPVEGQEGVVDFSADLDKIGNENSNASNMTAVGDINGDGTLDVIIANEIAPHLQLYLNINGTLVEQTSWQPNIRARTKSIALGDLDQDGYLELVVAGWRGLDGYITNTKGSLGSQLIKFSNAISETSTVALGDMDGNGGLDVVFGHAFSTQIFCNETTDSAIQFKECWHHSNGERRPNQRLALGDLDNNGSLDIVLGNYTTASQVLLNGESSQSIAFTTYPITNNVEVNEMGVRSVAIGDVDGDGKLDIGIAGSNGAYVCRNSFTLESSTFGRCQPIASAQDKVINRVRFVDVDVDGDLDIILAIPANPSLVCLNLADAFLSTECQPVTDGLALTGDVAVADFDGDSLVDLLFANGGDVTRNSTQPNILYKNSLHPFLASELESSDEGALLSDLVAAQHNEHTVIFVGRSNAETLAYLYDAQDGKRIFSLRDGDSQTNDIAFLRYDPLPTQAPVITGWLAVANGKPTQSNAESALEKSVLYAITITSQAITSTPVFTTPTNAANAVDLAIDGQNLYMVVGNGFTSTTQRQADSSYIYTLPLLPDHEIDMQEINTITLTISSGVGTVFDIAWNDPYAPTHLLRLSSADVFNIYSFTNGRAESLSPIPRSRFRATAIAWSDVNGDDCSDFAVGNGGGFNVLARSSVYLSDCENGWNIVWHSQLAGVEAIMWADVNDDGWPDLLLGDYGRSNHLYLNLAGQLSNEPILWGRSASDDSGVHPPNTLAVEVVDFDNDGDLDLLDGRKANHSITSLLEINLQPQLPRTVVITGVSPVDLNANVNIAYSVTSSIPNERFNVSFDSSFSAMTREEIIGSDVISLNLADNGLWGNTDSFELRLIADPITATRIFTNAVPGSLSQDRVRVSDNSLRYTNQTPGGYFVAQTAITKAAEIPLSAVQLVVVSGTVPISEAVIYHQTGDDMFVPLRDDATGVIQQTDDFGVLGGFGRIDPNAQLQALLPVPHGITWTDAISLYYTSAPTIFSEGVASNQITLTVDEERPLMLFNLDISLEWDASNDSFYLETLENDLQRTSEIIYDLTNGQAALGDLRIYHDKQNWKTSDIVIHASNDYRPHATLGGIVEISTGLTITSDFNGQTITETYRQGQVHMSAVWNRFGDPRANLGEDWPRTLAHELGHYLFFLSDHYLQVKNGLVVIGGNNSCRSAMNDAYLPENSEFSSDDCGDSVAAVVTGRSDWDTIEAFYRPLSRTFELDDSLQLAVTTIEVEPSTTEANFASVFYETVNQDSASVFWNGTSVAAYLLKGAGEQGIVPLGRPRGDNIIARGAMKNDLLCVQSSNLFGCGLTSSSKLTVSASSWITPLLITPTFRPDTSHETHYLTHTAAVTLSIDTANFSDFEGCLYALPEYVDDFAWLSNMTEEPLPQTPLISTSLPADPMTGTVILTSTHWFFSGHLIIADDACGTLLQANKIRYIQPFGFHNGMGPPVSCWGPNRAYGVHTQGFYGPVIGSDGKAMLFDLDYLFQHATPYQLQTILPNGLPSYLTPIGQAQRVTPITSTTATTTTLVFSYLQGDVPNESFEQEGYTRVYSRANAAEDWEPVQTSFDPQRNLASAEVSGAGEFMLAMTVQLPQQLHEGWNLVGYPLQTQHTITDALMSIAGSYDMVFTYLPTENPATDSWLFYATETADAPNTISLDGFAQAVKSSVRSTPLQSMTFGVGYWVHMTETATLSMPVDIISVNGVASGDMAVRQPPAIYFGRIANPPANVSLTAYINDQPCGSTTPTADGTFLLAVESGKPCGEPEALVDLRLNNRPIQTLTWQNEVFNQLGIIKLQNRAVTYFLVGLAAVLLFAICFRRTLSRT